MKKAFLKFLILLICAVFAGLFYLLLKVGDNFILGHFYGGFSLPWAIFWMITLLVAVLVLVKKINLSISSFLAISFFLLIALPLLRKILPSPINVADNFVLYAVFNNDEDGGYTDFYFRPIRCEGAKNILTQKEIIFPKGKTKFVTTEYSYRLAVFRLYFERFDKCGKGKVPYVIDTQSEITFFQKLLAEVMFSWLPALTLIFFVFWIYEEVRGAEFLKVEDEKDKILLGAGTVILGAIVLYNFYYQDLIKAVY
jgi:hypothetical protein